jgi:hypothetical protein
LRSVEHKLFFDDHRRRRRLYLLFISCAFLYGAINNILLGRAMERVGVEVIILEVLGSFLLLTINLLSGATHARSAPPSDAAVQRDARPQSIAAPDLPENRESQLTAAETLQHFAALIAALRNENTAMGRTGAELTSSIVSPIYATLPHLVAILGHGSEETRSAALAALAEIGRLAQEKQLPQVPLGEVVAAGKTLRSFREACGLTARDVTLVSEALAKLHSVNGFVIDSERLAAVEADKALPTVYWFYVFSVAYHTTVDDLMKLFGIDLTNLVGDFGISRPPTTHTMNLSESRGEITIPVKIDPNVSGETTFNLGSIIKEWGVVPLQYIKDLAKKGFTYAYIGTEDLTMYPLLLPGSFVQVDESLKVVLEGPWRSELERPIYLVETRGGYVCCWCSVRRGEIVLQSHHLSGVPPRILKFPEEADVIGQVVGVAMRFDSRLAAVKEEQQQTAFPSSAEGQQQTAFQETTYVVRSRGPSK